MPKRSSGATASNRQKNSHLCQWLLTPSKTATRGWRLWASGFDGSESDGGPPELTSPGEYGGGDD